MHLEYYCTIHAEHDDPVKHVFRTGYARSSRNKRSSAREPSTIMLIWPAGWDDTAAVHEFDHVYYAGPLTTAAHAVGASFAIVVAEHDGPRGRVR